MREMKDSGVAYIGNIPVTWNITRNKNVFFCSKNIVGNKSDKVQLLSLTTKGIKEKDINNAEGKLPESFDTYQFVTKEDIVMCLFDLDMSAVFSGISPYDGMISPAYKVLTCKNGMAPKYADYWFQYIFDGRKFNHYAKNIRCTLNYEDFSALPIIQPPLEVQYHIADYLDKKCAKIENIIAKQQEIIEKLRAYKSSIITETVTKGLKPNVEMKDSGIIWIGKIPSHWDILKLKAHTSMLTPMRDKPKDLAGEIPWIRIEDYIGKYIFESKEGFGVSLETVKEMNLKIYPVGAILCTSSCDLGKCAIVSKELVSNQRFIGIIPDDETLPDYLYYLMLANTERLNHLSTGTIQANLSRVAFEHLMVQFPPYEEQKQIADFLDRKCEAIDNAVEIKQRIIDKLTAYKKSLIYEAVTGKKEVVFK